MRKLKAVSLASKFVRAIALIGLSTVLANAEVILPAVLSEHMVAQRGTPVHIWGKASPGEAVTVSFRGETRKATADELGRWGVSFAPGDAGGPFELTIQASNRITFTDVLVGDVWVGSGQSNMEMAVAAVNDSSDEIRAADFPNIRLFRVDNTVADYPLTDVATKLPWRACTPETVADFSAVAYFFGRELHEKERVPIGLIESAWGGTAAESWTSLPALAADASLMPVFAERARMADARPETLLTLEKEERDFAAAASRAQAEGKTPPSRPWHPDFHAWAPAALYNAMIAPLTEFPIRGVIWYQGESNSGDKAPLYGRLFRTLIQDWRQAWRQPDLSFFFVQIANWKAGDAWPEVREAQRQALALRNTGMAVTIDIGDPVDIHPKNKQDVGHRLALAARAITYGEALEYSGPSFSRVSSEDQALRVWFDHDRGLQARGGMLKGFEIAGPDGAFVPADARIDGASLVVSSPVVSRPVFVRYGWSSNPECNLYNGEGLPASPFRSEAVR